MDLLVCVCVDFHRAQQHEVGSRTEGIILELSLELLVSYIFGGVCG